MLQQTRVDTVVDYFNRWVSRFPDIDSLAQADLHDVLMHWEGLGYYSRARNLHSAARLVREKHCGTVPSEYDTLRSLPGVGDYTAGAIASIAYNRRTPAVDGNVRRVLSRLFDVAAPNTASVRPIAEELVDPGRPGDFNQALMELGATICTPKSPSCSTCPASDLCLARARGTISVRPGVKPRKQVSHEHINVLVLLHRDSVLLSRRPARGLLGGLWEFVVMREEEVVGQLLGLVTHLFTHKRVSYHVHFKRGRRRTAENERWIPLGELDRYPLSAAQRKIEALLLQKAILTRTGAP